MNNSVTRIILGTLLPTFYFELVWIIVIIFSSGQIVINLEILTIIAYFYIIILLFAFIPSLILSILIEIIHRKEYENIYLSGASAGGLVSIIYFLIGGLIADKSIDIIEFALMLPFWGIFGVMIGIPTAIPLDYLYKRKLSQKQQINNVEQL